MGFIQPCFIRKNSKELRDKLEKLGHTICKCCEFDGADWLKVSCNAKMQYSVHGIGYTEKEGEIYGDITQEEVFKYFLKTTTSIDCGENEELFLALAALRDDSDYMQWFTYNNYWHKCLGNNFSKYAADWILFPDADVWHKATIEEIIQHFKE